MNEGTCKGCGAKILWLKTPRGKNMPVDTKPESKVIRNEDGEGVMVQAYTPHFATCPKADDFRKEKE